MDSKNLADLITEILIDRQGEDILILDLHDVTSFTDYFIICSTTSQRHLNALQEAIREELKKTEVRTLAKGVEGEADSGWILIDYNSVIVHLFDREMRSFYQLEQLWQNARVVARIQ